MILLPIGLMAAPAAGGALLLDGLGTAPSAVLGLERLLASYATNRLVRVRRSSDNAEADIGWGADNRLDAAALLAWCGAGSGFVSKWWDQSGSGADAGQPTAAAQPRIVSAGVLDRMVAGGRPALVFSGAQSLALGATVSGNLSVLATAARGAGSGLISTVLASASAGGASGVTLNVGNRYGPAPDGAKPRWYGNYANNPAAGWLDGAKQGGTNPFDTAMTDNVPAAIGATVTGTSAANPLTLGVSPGGASDFLIGRMGALVVVPAVLADAVMASLTTQLKAGLAA